MLVLTRKVGETIHVGDDVVIQVRKIAGNRVSIGIEAQRSVCIWRGEIAAEAMQGGAPDVPLEVSPPLALPTTTPHGEPTCNR